MLQLKPCLALLCIEDDNRRAIRFHERHSCQLLVGFPAFSLLVKKLSPGKGELEEIDQDLINILIFH